MKSGGVRDYSPPPDSPDGFVSDADGKQSSMELLIAVVSCAEDRWRVPAHRAMLAGHGADVRFFFGRGNCPGDADEIILDCSDDYFRLIEKVRGIFQWADERAYDFLFKIDADTECDVPRLLDADFERHEWVGLMGDRGESGGRGHCTSGGVGIWLSRRAVRSYLDNGHKVNGGKIMYWDDWHLSLILADEGFVPVHSDLLWNESLGPCPDEANRITRHGWTPDILHEETRGPARAKWRPGE